MSKTRSTSWFDYQLDRHCSKTMQLSNVRRSRFDYQLDRHCSKTGYNTVEIRQQFDYQLDRHCSKTVRQRDVRR